MNWNTAGLESSYCMCITKGTFLTLHSTLCWSCTCCLIVVRERLVFCMNWACRQRSRHCCIFIQWIWWADGIESKSWISFRTRWILAWKAWRLSFCRKLRIPSRSLACLSYCGLWYGRTFLLSLWWYGFTHYCSDQTESCSQNKNKRYSKRRYLYWDLMVWTPPRQTGHQKLKKSISVVFEAGETGD